MTDHLAGLNDAQKETVLHKEGPLLIVAGAGAGKTKAITHRILNLIKTGVAPRNILAITFTNKAAKEMRDRIIKLIQSDAGLNLPLTFSERPFVSTFHALGVHIVRENSLALGIPKHFTIADEGDALALMKEAIVSLSLDPKQFEPKRLKNVISRQKADLVTAERYALGIGNEYFPRILSSVWLAYEKLLAKNGSLDFDDLILRAVLFLEHNEEVRTRYQNLWQYIHIDEYQDTNVSQYRFSKLLAGERKNICVVGDMDQCLPGATQIATAAGLKPIEKMRKGDMVQSAAGHGALCVQPIQKVHKRFYNGDLISIRTKKGARLSLTPGHMVFADLAATRGVYYTYLMYRRDKGCRIGVVQSIRSFNKNKKENGLRTRSNQEHADRIWILKVSPTRAKAQYWEQWFAFTYGIPTTVFYAGGRGMDMSEREISDLFASIPTKERVENLFRDTGLVFDYPHYAPQGTTLVNTERRRVKIRLTLCDDGRKSGKNPWGMSRLCINTTSRALKQKLIREGFTPRKGKRNDWRLEITRLDYGELERLARSIEKLDPSLSITRTAAITKNKRLFFQPAANMLPTMSIAYRQNDCLVNDTIMHVEKKPYRGAVYDLDVAHTHNYIAERIPVHNSIYSWRGADFRNILNFEKDYPEAKVVLLEENYRSTANILTAANDIIKKNKVRKEKNLFTKKEGGEKIGLYSAYDENDEAFFVASKAAELIGGDVSPKDIAVLYRANFQSRVLEEAFLSHQIPYQVLGVKFFERKEVKDVLSFLRCALNQESYANIKRIINVPPRGIGKVTLLKMFSGEEEKLPEGARKKVSEFRAMLGEIKEYALNKKTSETVKFIMGRSGIETMLKKGTEDDKERLENIRELVTLATKYDVLEPEEGVSKLLEDAALASDQDSLVANTKKEEDAVRLMTVHASKGLEFPYVFITGLEQDLFPHGGFGNAGDGEDRAEEERRLFYVALTRAEKKCYLTYASVRTIFGMKQVNAPSEFIIDIDAELIEDEQVVMPTISLDS